jgi:hypothetical protein
MKYPYSIASIILFAILFLLIGATFWQYGLTCDEGIHNLQGELIYRYYASHGKDLAALQYTNLYLYGGFFCTSAYTISHLFTSHQIEIRHLLNALFGLLGIYGCWKIGNLFYRAAGGFWCALLLATTPLFYGHMFANPKDIPFAVGYIWALYYILLSLHYLPHLPKRIALAIGLAFGVTLGVRVGGLLLFGYLGLAWFLFFLFNLPKDRNQKLLPHYFLAITKLIVPAAIIIAVTYSVMVVSWPWVRNHTIHRVLQALREMANFQSGGSSLFRGVFVMDNHVPWYYLPWYLLIQLPEIVLVFLLPAAMLILAKFRKKIINRLDRIFLIRVGLLLLAVFFPIVYAIFKNSDIYDGMRHFLFLVPPLVCLAGIGLVNFINFSRTKFRGSPKYIILAIALFFAWHLSIMIRLHPYQYVYFNSIVGGLPGAYMKYETDYWCASYKEGLDLLVTYLKKTDGKAFPEKTYKVCSGFPGGVVDFILPKNFVMDTTPGQVDYILILTRYNQHLVASGKEIARVERMGVPLTFVKKLR